MKKITGLVAFLLMLLPTILLADKPEPWQLGFQKPATELMQRYYDFHEFLLFVIVAITIFVTILLAYTCVRFRASRNPVPSKTSHNALIEIIWTAIPTLILVAISVPSLKILFFMHDTPEVDMTLKVVGHQWYWEYIYPDHEDIQFDSYPIADEDLKEGDLRNLSVDNQVVLPVDTNIRVLFTSTDVLHNWALPAFGIKVDTIPGRVNEAWFNIKRPGVYYGQCSELCGIGHAFMPIAVKAVTREQFAEWVNEAKDKF